MFPRKVGFKFTSRWNANALTETKTGTLKHKISDIKDNYANGANDQLVTLYNEATPNAAVFAATAPAVAASVIAPDAHFLSSGLKLDTELFLKGNIKNMADKGTIDTIPYLNTPDTDNPNAAAQYAGSTGSNSPYLLRNHNPPFPPNSTNTTENQKRRKQNR